MTALFLLLAACAGGGTGETETVDLRQRYHDMEGCVMEAAVTCGQEGLEWSAVLRCEYVPGGESTVEVLEPASIAGIQEDGTPLRGEIAVDGEMILTADFTSFVFYDTINPEQ